MKEDIIDDGKRLIKYYFVYEIDEHTFQENI